MPTSPRHSTTKPLLTSVGGGVPDAPNEQRTSSYISERKRQRRQRRDDTKLRHHPTENPACRPKRKIHRRVSRFPATSRPPIGTLPRNSLASSATGGASAISRNHPISGALFGTFPVREKYPAGGMDKPDLPANLPSHGKKQTRRNSRRVLICQKVSQSSRLWSLEKIQSVFCGGAYAAKNTLRAAQCRSAAYSGARRGSE